MTIPPVIGPQILCAVRPFGILCQGFLVHGDMQSNLSLEEYSF